MTFFSRPVGTGPVGRPGSRGLAWVRSCLFLASLAPTGAIAQDDWAYRASLYGWFPGIANSVETPFGDLEAEVDFSQVFEALDMAAFAAFEAQRGRWSFVGDFAYVDLGVTQATPFGVLFSDARLGNKATLLTGYTTYAVVDGPDLRFDLGGGLRYINLEVDTFLDGVGPVSDRRFSSGADWVDPVIVARVEGRITDTWTASAFVDVGGFGIGNASDLTWQAYVGAGYSLNDTWSIVGGYRHLSIERTIDDADVTVGVSGPIFGVQARF